jgi:hypothetical protein
VYTGDVKQPDIQENINRKQREMQSGNAAGLERIAYDTIPFLLLRYTILGE